MNRRLLAAILGSLVSASILLQPTTSAAAPTVQLTPVRIVGGPGHAGLYGWGAATMSDGSVLFGDYWNYRVQHYATDGTLLGTAVPRDGNHQAPFGIAVDLRDDSIYVSDTDGGRNIDKYDRNGNYLFSFGSQQIFKYPSWLAVDSTGRVAVGDSTGNKVVVFNDQGTKLYQFGTSGTAAGQFKDPRGMAFDANGNLYVADLGNQRIEVFAVGASSATFLRQWSVVGGDFRGLAVDDQNGWVYLVNSGKGMINKFDLQGNPLLSWGGFGTAPGKFLDGGRGITVDGDSNVWVGDMPNFRAQKFSPTGQYLLQAPNPPAPPPPGGFNMPGSVALDAAGNIFVMDTFNWRVQKLAPSGAFIKQWGRRGGATVPYAFQYPHGIAVDTQDGSVVVADTDNTAIKKYTNDGTFLWTTTGVKCFAVDVALSGTIYAADFQQNVVKVLSPSGVLVSTFGAGSLSNPRGLGVDADGSVWVTSRNSGTVSHFSAGGTILGQFGSKGSAIDQLDQAADIVTDTDRVFVADQSANLIKVWSKAGVFLGAFGGGGSGLGRMFGPEGLEMTPDGRLYVAEATGERIQEFAVTDGTPDTNAPDTTITSPSDGAVLASGPIAISGSASDDRGVASVQVGIQNTATSQWWNGSSWSAPFVELNASLGMPGETTTTWSYTFSAPAGGSFAVRATATDTSASADASPATVSFSTSGTVDTTPPNAVVSAPATNSVLPLGPIIINGSAADNVGVVAVRVSIRNNGLPTGSNWWNGSGWGAFTYVTATLGSPGGPSTSWTYTFNALATGSYGFQVRSVDAVGNLGANTSWRSFSVI